MGKKILKWVVIIGAIGLFAFVVLFIISFGMIKFNTNIKDTASGIAYSQPEPSTKIMRSVDSTLHEISIAHSHQTTSQQLFDSLTFGYQDGGGFSSNVMYISNMFTADGYYKWVMNSTNSETRPFVKLPWLTLKSATLEKGFPIPPLEAYNYYVENGKSYLSLKQPTKLKNHNNLVNGEYKQIGFFIHIDQNKLNNSFSNYEDLDVYIPLDNKKEYKFLKNSNIVFTFLPLILYLCLIWKSGAIVLAISNNRPFDRKNVKRLKQCVWMLLILIFLPYILMISLYLGFYKILNGYVQVKSWMDIINWKLWIILVIYFSLFLAFFRGNKLQTDQEYTI